MGKLPSLQLEFYKIGGYYAEKISRVLTDFDLVLGASITSPGPLHCEQQNRKYLHRSGTLQVHAGRLRCIIQFFMLLIGECSLKKAAVSLLSQKG
jgi:hypothetical protein